MAHPNEAMLRAGYAAFASGHVQTLVDLFADDIEWHVSGRSPVAGVYSGKEEVLGFFGKMWELYGGTLQLQVIDVLANNERGIVLTAEHAGHDGNPLEYTAVHVWGVRAGKLARFAAYNDDAYNAYWR
jgi:ketosteroid isomerase-like protein